MSNLTVARLVISHLQAAFSVATFAPEGPGADEAMGYIAGDALGFIEEGLEVPEDVYPEEAAWAVEGALRSWTRVKPEARPFLLALADVADQELEEGEETFRERLMLSFAEDEAVWRRRR